MSQFFASGGQSIGVSASASVLPMNIQGCFPLVLTGLILQYKGLSRVFSNTTVQKRQFFSTWPSSWSNSHIHTWLLEGRPEPWTNYLRNRNLNEDHIFEHLKGQGFPIFKRCFSYSYWQNLPLAKVINNENFLLQYYIFSFLIMSLILQVSLSRFYSPHTYTPKIQTPTQKSILWSIQTL